MLKRILILALGILTTYFIKAQETTSEITGMIHSDSLALAGATITAVHTPSGSTYKTTSRSDGRFNLPNVRIGGPYKITVTYVGYAPAEQQDITLTLGQEYKADFALVPETKQLNEVTITNSGTGGKVFNSSHTGNQE